MSAAGGEDETPWYMALRIGGPAESLPYTPPPGEPVTYHPSPVHRPRPQDVTAAPPSFDSVYTLPDAPPPSYEFVTQSGMQQYQELPDHIKQLQIDGGRGPTCHAAGDHQDTGVLSIYSRDDDDNEYHVPTSSTIRRQPETIPSAPSGEPWFHQLRVGERAGPTERPLNIDPVSQQSSNSSHGASEESSQSTTGDPSTSSATPYNTSRQTSSPDVTSQSPAHQQDHTQTGSDDGVPWYEQLRVGGRAAPTTREFDEAELPTNQMTINRADSDVDDSGILSMYARDDEDDLIHSPSATPIFLPPEVTRTPPRGEPWYHQLRVGQPAGPFAAPTAASPASDWPRWTPNRDEWLNASLPNLDYSGNPRSPSQPIITNSNNAPVTPSAPELENNDVRTEPTAPVLIEAEDDDTSWYFSMRGSDV